jgi:hypothetical protein
MAVDIIDSLSQAMKVVPAQEKVLISGDFNCPINKPTRKTNEVLTFFEGEGLKLINDKSMPTHTYIYIYIYIYVIMGQVK